MVFNCVETHISRYAREQIADSTTALAYSAQPLGFLSSAFLVWMLYKDRKDNIFNMSLFSQSLSFLVYNFFYIATYSNDISKNEPNKYVYASAVLMRETAFLIAHFSSSILSYSIYYLMQHKKPLRVGQMQRIAVIMLVIILSLYLSFGIAQFYFDAPFALYSASFSVSLLISVVCSFFNFILFLYVEYLFRERYVNPERKIISRNSFNRSSNSTEQLAATSESRPGSETSENGEKDKKGFMKEISTKLVRSLSSVGSPPDSQRSSINRRSSLSDSSFSRQTVAIGAFLSNFRFYPITQSVCLFPIFFFNVTCGITNYGRFSSEDPTLIAFYVLTQTLYSFNSVAMAVIYYLCTPDLVRQVKTKLGCASNGIEDKGADSDAASRPVSMYFSEYRSDRETETRGCTEIDADGDVVEGRSSRKNSIRVQSKRFSAGDIELQSNANSNMSDIAVNNPLTKGVEGSSKRTTSGEKLVNTTKESATATASSETTDVTDSADIETNNTINTTDTTVANDSAVSIDIDSGSSA